MDYKSNSNFGNRHDKDREFPKSPLLIFRPPLNVHGEFSVILAGFSGELFSVDLLAKDEFEAVALAIDETGWNYHGEITVDTPVTIRDDLEPLLCFEYEVL